MDYIKLNIVNVLTIWFMVIALYLVIGGLRSAHVGFLGGGK